MHRGEATTYRAAGPPVVPVRMVPRRGHLGSLSLAQLLVAEAVLLALAASLAAPPVVWLLIVVVSAVLVAVFFARRQNRWWLEYRRVARDHRLRRAARFDPRPGPVLAALRTIAPGLTVRDVEFSGGAVGVGRDGAVNVARDGAVNVARDGAVGVGRNSAVGVGRDEAGWFSVVALDSAAVPPPLDTLLGIVAGTTQPGLIMALVTHTVPAPSPEVPAAAPAGVSYRQLTEATGAGPAPAHRESSISLRIDARVLAEALLDGTADPEAAAALVAGLARKTATGLRRLGVAGRPLDADGLLALLARSCDVVGARADGPGPDEEWSFWRSARLVHRTYWLRTWPGSATEIGPLFAWASTAPAAQTSVALVVGIADADAVPVRAFIRLSTRPDADVAILDRVLVEAVRRAGGELQPLDGEQGPAAYATAPTGGGAG